MPNDVVCKSSPDSSERGFTFGYSKRLSVSQGSLSRSRCTNLSFHRKRLCKPLPCESHIRGSTDLTELYCLPGHTVTITVCLGGVGVGASFVALIVSSITAARYIGTCLETKPPLPKQTRRSPCTIVRRFMIVKDLRTWQSKVDLVVRTRTRYFVGLTEH